MGCGVSRQKTPNEALLKLKKEEHHEEEEEDAIINSEEFILTREDTQISAKDITEANTNDELAYPVLTGAELAKMLRWVSDVESFRNSRIPIPELVEIDDVEEPPQEMCAVSSIPS